MAGTKTNYFNVLKLRACAKPAHHHCKQAKESSVDIWIPEFWQMSWRRYEQFTGDISVPQMLPLELPWDSQWHR